MTKQLMTTAREQSFFAMRRAALQRRCFTPFGDWDVYKIFA